jgi:methionyl-tRNA formyltransferase
MGWNQIIKKNILSIPKYGWIGSHPTKLPAKGGKQG